MKYINEMKWNGFTFEFNGTCTGIAQLVRLMCKLVTIIKSVFNYYG